MKETRVLIGTPLKGDVSAAYSKTLIELMVGKIPGISFGHIYMSGTCVMGARDRLAREMEVGDWDRLLFWDADLKPTTADFVRLLSHPAEMVCAPYCKREVLTHWHFFPVSPEADIQPSGLWQMAQAAIGFSVTDKNVFNRIKARYPGHTYTNQEQGVDKIQLHQYFPWQIVGPNSDGEKLDRLRKFMNGKLDRPFNATELLIEISNIVDADEYSQNLMQGEDYGFCRMAREVGTEIWLDTKLVVPHGGECDYPIAHDDLIKMTVEPWRQDHWAEIKAKMAKK